MGKRITEDQKAEVLKYRAKGYSYKDIYELTGISPATTAKIIKEDELADTEEPGEIVEEGMTSDDYWQKIVEAKDAHIKSLETILIGLTANNRGNL